MFRRAMLQCCILIGCVIGAVSPGRADPPPAPPHTIEPLPDATPITLHLVNQDAKSAFDQFAQLAGLKIATDSQTWVEPRVVSIDATQRPYWEVYNDLSAQAGVINYDLADAPPNSYGLHRDQIFWNSRPAIVSGPFRVDVSGINLGQSLVYGSPSVTPCAANINLEIYAEPHLPVLAAGEMEIKSLADEAGQAMQILPERWHNRPPFNRQQRTSFNVRFSPNPQSTKIAVIKGTIPVAIASSFAVLEKTSIDKTGTFEKEIEGMIFGITIKPGERGCELKIHVDYDPENAADVEKMDLIRLGLTTNVPRLLDARGREYLSPGGGGGGSDFDFNFDKQRFGQPVEEIGDPTTLIWKLPTKARWVNVPFEFHNLPLR